MFGTANRRWHRHNYAIAKHHESLGIDFSLALRAYDSVGEARASIDRYMTLYNGRRPYSSFDRQTPDQAYFDRLPQIAAA